MFLNDVRALITIINMFQEVLKCKWHKNQQLQSGFLFSNKLGNKIEYVQKNDILSKSNAIFILSK